MHLRYSLITAHMDCGETRHAQAVMKELGITYSHSTPQSLYDSWWFWNCENIPPTLPKYLTELTVKPADAIGHGLSASEAAEVVALRDEAYPTDPVLQEKWKRDEALRIEGLEIAEKICRAVEVEREPVDPDEAIGAMSCQSDIRAEIERRRAG